MLLADSSYIKEEDIRQAGHEYEAAEPMMTTIEQPGGLAASLLPSAVPVRVAVESRRYGR